MRIPTWSIAGLALAGCLGGQSGENSLEICEGAVYEDVEPGDASLGFTAQDVVDSLISPIGVRWESGESDLAADALAITQIRVDSVQIADFSATEAECPRVGRQLAVHLMLDVTVGDDAVRVGDGWLDVLAADAAPEAVEVMADWGLPAELSGSYADAYDGWWQTQRDAFPNATDWENEGTWVTLIGPWTAMSMDVEAQYRNSEVSSASMLWRGPVVFEAPTTP